MVMQTNTQFAAIKWIKNELQLSLQQGRSMLEAVQLNFDNEVLENFALLITTLANNLELANDEIGSTLCVELSQAAKFISSNGQQENADTSVADVMHGVVILNDHIENICLGLRVDTQAIGDIIDELRVRQSQPEIQKSLLYSLDLTNVVTQPSADSNDEKLQSKAGEIRPNFQRKLLEWFQNEDKEVALDDLAHMSLSIAELTSIELIELYFTASGFVIEDVLNGHLEDSKDVKTLIGQIDKQLKVLAAHGEARLAMGMSLGLVRQTLYYVAKSPSEDNRVVELQNKFSLKESLLASVDGESSIHSIQALGSIATAVREEFKNIKHWLQDIVEHDKPAAEEIDHFIHSAEGWAQTLDVVGEEELSENIADFVRRLAFCIYGSSEPEESQLLELAGDWLKIDETLINIENTAGTTKKSEVGAEGKDEDSESPLIVSTANTILDELSQIKDIISEDIENNSNDGEVRWEEIRQLLNHTQAACHFIELEKASKLIADSRTYISAVIERSDYPIVDRDVSSIADIVSSVELILEDVANNVSHQNRSLSLAEEASAYLLERVEFIEAGVFEEQKSAPIITLAIDNVKEIDGIEVSDEAVNDALENLNETSIAKEHNQDIDEDDLEILEIFIEEAEEISGELVTDLARWAQEQADKEALKDVRRAFHTLKGSGRLAKVEFLAETAWSIENMLNRVMEDELKVNDEMMSLISYFVTTLPEWVTKISGQRPSLDDMSEVINAANAMETGEQADLSFIPTEIRVSNEPEFDAELYEIFSAETALHLETVDKYIKSHEGQKTTYVSEPLFRALHTIEGCAAMSHFDEIETLTHELGSYVRELNDNKALCDVAVIQPILTEYVRCTQIQIRALIESTVDVPDHTSLSEMIAKAHTDLTAQLSRQSVIEAEEEIAAEEEKAAVDKARAEKAQAEKAQAEKAQAEKVAADKAQAERARADQAATEKAQAEKAAADKAQAEKVAAEKAQAEKAQAEKVAAGKAQAEKVQAEKVAADKAAAVEQTDVDIEMQGFFIEEGVELLEELTTLFQTWISNVEDKSPLDKVLHILHTLKGSSLLVGLTDFGGIAHEIESLLESHEAKKIPYTEAELNRLLSVSDNLLVALQDDTLRENSAYYGSLLETVKQKDNEATVKVEPVKQKETAVVTKLPARKKIDQKDQKAIVRKLKSVASNTDQSVKISNTLLDRLIADVGEVNVSQGQLSQKNKARQLQIQELTLTIDRLRQQLRKLEIETEAQVLFKVDKAAEETGFDPLELDRYTQVQQISRSLLESISDLEDIRETLQAADEEMSLLLHKESQLTDTLLEDLLRTRMVDFSRFSPRFERLVRQLGTDLNKPAKLSVQGGETEIDRFILNELQASIEHIIRNAMAHAVETPEERAKAKKDKTADINLHLSREGSEIHLIISDDGRGIDTERVRKKAISLGMLQESDQLSDEDLVQYILKPGFSTADEVSKLSGRGIGMDIVNDTIRDIGGALTITSTKGKGAAFHLIFPYTMAINMALMVKAGGVTYAVPNNYIENVVRVPIDLIRQNLEAEKPVLVQGNKQYELHELSRLLDPGQSTVMSSQQRWVYVVLMDLRQERHAVVVDQLIGNKEIVVKPLSLHMDLIPWLSGSAVSSTGDVTLILDLPALAEVGVAKEEHVVEEVVEEDLAPLVMVVDDSITFRKVATRLLLREGYRVVDARDGVEAVEKLSNVTPDAFLLDVEMPRMDGFDLARHIRHTDGIDNCPIVMVTSRTGEKHQNHAKEIGVDDYFGKPFNNKALIESINSLLEVRHAGA
ncbi:MAG: hypothetical protein COB22_02465 [Cycloclasticus sp.]|nr:MAG: hypothetical protein COB22_02465 [Cycloclasticus sp.]